MLWLSASALAGYVEDVAVVAVVGLVHLGLAALAVDKAGGGGVAGMPVEEGLLHFALRQVEVVAPAAVGQNEGGHGRVAGVDQGLQIGGHGAYLRVGVVPEVGDGGGAAGGEPCGVGDGQEAAGPDVPAPQPQPSGEADVVDGAFGPDGVEGVVGKGQAVHRRLDGGQAGGQTERVGAGAQTVEEVGEEVEGGDAAAEDARQKQCRRAGAAAEVGHVGGGRQSGDEREGAQGGFVAAGALAVDARKVFADESVVEVVDGIVVMIIVHDSDMFF